MSRGNKGVRGSCMARHDAKSCLIGMFTERPVVAIRLVSQSMRVVPQDVVPRCCIAVPLIRLQ